MPNVVLCRGPIEQTFDTAKRWRPVGSSYGLGRAKLQTYMPGSRFELSCSQCCPRTTNTNGGGMHGGHKCGCRAAHMGAGKTARNHGRASCHRSRNTPQCQLCRCLLASTEHQSG